MIVVVNKIDLFPEAERAAKIDKVTKGLRKALAATKFANSPIIPLAANVGASELGASLNSMGLELLFDSMRSFIKPPPRNPAGPFLFAVDHWYALVLFSLFHSVI